MKMDAGPKAALTKVQGLVTESCIHDLRPGCKERNGLSSLNACHMLLVWGWSRFGWHLMVSSAHFQRSKHQPLPPFLVGVDALGSSAAALAAASIVARTHKPDKEKIYRDTAKALYALAETQLKAAPPAKDKALAAPILSYCGAVDSKTGVNKCNFTVKAIETVPVRPATAPSIEGFT